MIKSGFSSVDADKFVFDLVSDRKSIELAAIDKAILNYAIKLTQSPAEMNGQDVQNLRLQGLDDLAIHDLCAVVGYFAFVNRIADGLGVELEQN